MQIAGGENHQEKPKNPEDRQRWGIHINKVRNVPEKEGIRYELTVPKTPQQNGVAERLNRTLVDMSRSMLIDAKLPKKFWAKAVSTAVYLQNRSSSKPLQNMTPYEA